MKNSSGAEVIDCCFLSEKQLAFIRADGLFQVSSIVGDVIEIELRDSLHDKPQKLHLLEQSVLITTGSTTMYELQFAQRLSNPIKHKGDQIII